MRIFGSFDLSGSPTEEIATGSSLCASDCFTSAGVGPAGKFCGPRAAPSGGALTFAMALVPDLMGPVFPGMTGSAFPETAETAFPGMTGSAFLETAGAAFPGMTGSAFLEIAGAAFPRTTGSAFLETTGTAFLTTGAVAATALRSMTGSNRPPLRDVALIVVPSGWMMCTIKTSPEDLKENALPRATAGGFVPPRLALAGLGGSPDGSGAASSAT